MARTDRKVSHIPGGLRPASTRDVVSEVERCLRLIGGRWKLAILFELFGGCIRRFSELERAIPLISQKMLIQQLRQLEKDGLVRRIVHAEAPPRVEYGLTGWGQSLRPALEALQAWGSADPVGDGAFRADA